MKQKAIDLLKDPVGPLYRKFLFPSIGATFVYSIYILGDTILVGRGVGSMGIAALNLLLPLFSLFYATGLMFGVGGSVLVNFEKGRGNEEEARAYFTAALWGAAVIAAVYEILCGIFFDPITKFLGSNQTMASLVEQYGRVLTAGCPVFLASSLLQTFVCNDKAPKTAMCGVIAGGITNVVLDYVFMFPLKMGMAGGAAATVIGSCVSVIIFLSHFLSPHNSLKLTRQVGLTQIWKVAVNGLSSFVLDFSNGVVILLFNRQLLRWAGDMGVVVYGIVSNSALVVNSISKGIGQAVQPLLAANKGAGFQERMDHALALARKYAIGAGITFMLIGLMFPSAVTGIFVTPTADILKLAIPAVRIYFTAFLLTGFNMLNIIYLQANLNPAASLAISIGRGFVFSGILVCLLPQVLGVQGIWATMLITEILALLLGTVLMKKEKAGQNF